MRCTECRDCVVGEFIVDSNRRLAAILDHIAEIGSYFVSSRAGMLSGSPLDGQIVLLTPATLRTVSDPVNETFAANNALH